MKLTGRYGKRNAAAARRAVEEAMAHLALLGHTPQVSKMDRDGIDNPRWAVRCTACHISSHVTPRGVPMCGTDLLEGASAMLTENTCEESKRLPPVFFDPSRRGATP